MSGKKIGKPQKFYVFYNKLNDEIVAIGTADECAVQFGKTRDYLLQLATYIRSGRNKKYELYTERF